MTGGVHLYREGYEVAAKTCVSWGIQHHIHDEPCSSTQHLALHFAGKVPSMLHESTVSCGNEPNRSHDENRLLDRRERAGVGQCK
jgi:hypothetical protein